MMAEKLALQEQPAICVDVQGSLKRRGKHIVKNPMAHVSYSDLRNNLASYMDAVFDDRAPLVITRRNARSVVLISEEDYEGLIETVHLLESPANAMRLLRSIKEADEGN